MRKESVWDAVRWVCSGRTRIAIVLLAAALSAPVHAQMLSYTRAIMTTPDLHQSSPAYQVEYRQGLFDGVSGSIDYLNEGHVTGHHRDGYAFELSYRLSLLANHGLYVAASVGPYYYFDTIDEAANLHGVAPLASLTAYGALGHKWFWSVNATRINPTTDIKTNMVGLGVGYWLGNDGVEMSKDLPAILTPAPSGWFEQDEITAFGVFSVINISSNPHALGGSVEYRHRFQQHIEGTITYIYEGDPRVARRSGVAVQAWPVRTAVWSQLEIGIGAGGYGFIDRKRIPPPGQKGNAAIAGLISMMVSYDLPHDWVVRAIWDRAVTDYSRDADIWRLGLGHKL